MSKRQRFQRLRLLLLLLLSTNIYKTPLTTLIRAQMRSLEMTDRNANRNVLSLRLNVSKFSEAWIVIGNLFHSLGEAVANSRSPLLHRFVRGIANKFRFVFDLKFIIEAPFG